MNQYKNKIIFGLLIALVLTFLFQCGGNVPGLYGLTPQSKKTDVTVKNAETTKKEFKENGEADSNIPITEESQPVIEERKVQKQEGIPFDEENVIGEVSNEIDAAYVGDKEENFSRKEEISSQTGQSVEEDIKEGEANTAVSNKKDKYLTDPIPEGKPLPVEPQDAVVSYKELTCTLSVRCDTILNNIAWLDKDKVDIVPKDGVIFAEKTVTFYEGESVFNLLMREMKRNKIHMEFENTPIYNSAYIEGIANLYEFDCGELSGWMYKVNDWFPNYGCSRYQLKAGDKVEWVYTCDLGVDVGGYYAAKGE